MKKIVGIIILISILLVACTPATIIPTATPAPLPTATLTIAPKPTSTPKPSMTPTVTVTPKPTETKPPTDADWAQKLGVDALPEWLSGRTTSIRESENGKDFILTLKDGREVLENGGDFYPIIQKGDEVAARQEVIDSIKANNNYDVTVPADRVRYFKDCQDQWVCSLDNEVRNKPFLPNMGVTAYVSRIQVAFEHTLYVLPIVTDEGTEYIVIMRLVDSGNILYGSGSYVSYSGIGSIDAKGSSLLYQADLDLDIKTGSKGKTQFARMDDFYAYYRQIPLSWNGMFVGIGLQLNKAPYSEKSYLADKNLRFIYECAYQGKHGITTPPKRPVRANASKLL